MCLHNLFYNINPLICDNFLSNMFFRILKFKHSDFSSELV